MRALREKQGDAFNFGYQLNFDRAMKPTKQLRKN